MRITVSDTAFMNVAQRALELHGFEFKLTDFNNEMLARYKTSALILRAKNVTGDEDRMRAQLYADCLEFLESRAKVKGE